MNGHRWTGPVGPVRAKGGSDAYSPTARAVATRLLLFACPDQNAAHHFATKIRVGLRSCLNVQPVTFNPIEPYLLRTIPGFIPRYIDLDDDLVPLDMVPPGIGEHRAECGRSIRVRFRDLAPLCGLNHDPAT